MRYALSPSLGPLWRRLAEARAVLAFDFDGTLAPIAAHPDRARMRPSTRDLLQRLAARHPCIAISGRPLPDVREKFADLRFRRLFGNHGAEPWSGAAALRRQVRQWRARLELDLPPLPGLWVEDKRLSLTIHYRQCPNKRAARIAILKAAVSLRGVRIVPGKLAVSLVSPDAPDKGAALAAALKRIRRPLALYIGDEETDEVAFSLQVPGLSLVTIRVGYSRRSRAAYYLRSQRDIDRLLRLILNS